MVTRGRGESHIVACNGIILFIMTYIHTYIHTHAHTHIHTRTYIHTHTHTMSTGSNGSDYMFLLKGHEDLRQDERVMQLFGLVNTLLSNDPETLKRHLRFVVGGGPWLLGITGWGRAMVARDHWLGEGHGC